MRKSFTLIELIVVIAIIAILAAIIAPNAFKAIEKAKVAQCISDFKTIKDAGQTYYIDTGFWPVNDDDVCVPQPQNCINGRDFKENDSNRDGWDGPYAKPWPKPPWRVPGKASGYQWLGAWADYNGDGVREQSIEMWIGGNEHLDFVRSKALLLDEILDDGDLSTGNFLMAIDAGVPKVINTDCETCIFFNAGIL